MHRRKKWMKRFDTIKRRSNNRDLFQIESE